MTSPVSIGDAFLMAKLALKLGQTFTKGRKSAPAEFREVENQLYSLSAALSALDKFKTTRQGQGEGEDILRSMLENCRETLSHLEAIVDKYSRFNKETNANEPARKRWPRALADNWKKIQWTTEGGDLATLRSQLTVHTNSLNLVLGVMNNTQTDRLECQVNEVADMLKEIHLWFNENLKDQRGPSQPAASERTSLVTKHTSSALTFELHSQAEGSPSLICKTASLDPKWDEKRASQEGSSGSQKRLFMCNCRAQTVSGEHQLRLAAFSLSPLTFPMRLAGPEVSWMIYKTADRTSNRLVSLVIKAVPPSRTSEFEETFIEALGLSRARALLGGNIDTMMAYEASADKAESAPQARILDRIGDLDISQKDIERVTLSANKKSYTRSSIQTIQLFHYKTLEKNILIHKPSLHRQGLSHCDNAEIVISYEPADPDSDDTDITGTILYLKHNTRSTVSSEDSRVKLHAIECTSIASNGEHQPVMRSVDVSLQFSTKEACTRFQAKIEEMRLELFVVSLQTPQPQEKLALKLQARGVRTEEWDLADSDISILRSSTTGRLRMIVVSRDGRTVISQVLAEDFLSRRKSGSNFGCLTYVVAIVDVGVRSVRKVYKYDNGFKLFNFSDLQTDQLFELGLASISEGAGERVLGLLEAPGQG